MVEKFNPDDVRFLIDRTAYWLRSLGSDPGMEPGVHLSPEEEARRMRHLLARIAAPAAFARRDPEARSLRAWHLVEEGEGAEWRVRGVGQLLQELVDVIPVAERQTRDGGTMVVRSVERYTDGFVVNTHYLPRGGYAGGR